MSQSVVLGCLVLGRKGGFTKCFVRKRVIYNIDDLYWIERFGDQGNSKLISWETRLWSDWCQRSPDSDTSGLVSLSWTFPFPVLDSINTVRAQQAVDEVKTQLITMGVYCIGDLKKMHDGTDRRLGRPNEGTKKDNFTVFQTGSKP